MSAPSYEPGTWGFQGVPKPAGSRAANEAHAASMRARLAMVIPEFVVLRHDGTEHSRQPDISAAGDAMVALGNGACVIAPDGVLLRFMADAVRSHEGEALARRAVKAWRGAR